MECRATAGVLVAIAVVAAACAGPREVSVESAMPIAPAVPTDAPSVPVSTAPPNTMPGTVAPAPPPLATVPAVPPSESADATLAEFYGPDRSFGFGSARWEDIELARHGSLVSTPLSAGDADAAGEATIQAMVGTNGFGMFAVGSSTDESGTRRATTWQLGVDAPDDWAAVSADTAPAVQRQSGDVRSSAIFAGSSIGPTLLLVGAQDDDTGSIPTIWTRSQDGAWTTEELPGELPGGAVAQSVVVTSSDQVVVAGVALADRQPVLWSSYDGGWTMLRTDGVHVDRAHLATGSGTVALVGSSHPRRTLDRSEPWVTTLWLYEASESGLLAIAADEVTSNGRVVDIHASVAGQLYIFSNDIELGAVVHTGDRPVLAEPGPVQWVSTRVGRQDNGEWRGDALAIDELYGSIVLMFQTPYTDPPGVVVADLVGEPGVDDEPIAVEWPFVAPVAAYYEREISAFPAVVLADRVLTIDTGASGGPVLSRLSTNALDSTSTLLVDAHRSSPYERVLDLVEFDGSLVAVVQRQEEFSPYSWGLAGTRLSRLVDGVWTPWDLGEFAGATRIAVAQHDGALYVAVSYGLDAGLFSVRVDAAGTERIEMVGQIPGVARLIEATADGALLALVDAGGIEEVLGAPIQDGGMELWGSLEEPPGEEIVDIGGLCRAGTRTLAVADGDRRTLVSVSGPSTQGVQEGPMSALAAVVDEGGYDRRDGDSWSPYCSGTDTTMALGQADPDDAWRGANVQHFDESGVVGARRSVHLPPRSRVNLVEDTGNGILGVGSIDDEFASSDAIFFVTDGEQVVGQLLAGGAGLQEALTATRFNGALVIGGSVNGVATVWSTAAP